MSTHSLSITRPSRPDGNQRAFTLTELLAVIVATMVIATLAVPLVLRSRIAANEATAISSIQSVVRAQLAYQARYPTQGFASSLAELGGPTPCVPSAAHACILDRHLTEGAKSGYNFATVVTERSANGIVTGYVVGAAPQAYNQSGVRWFCSTSGAPIRFGANTERRITPPGHPECLGGTPLE
jgi:type IV pilus assembly protein PilA